VIVHPLYRVGSAQPSSLQASFCSVVCRFDTGGNATDAVYKSTLV